MYMYGQLRAYRKEAVAGCSADREDERATADHCVDGFVCYGLFIFGSGLTTMDDQQNTVSVSTLQLLQLPQQKSTNTVVKLDLSDEPMNKMSTKNPSSQTDPDKGLLLAFWSTESNKEMSVSTCIVALVATQHQDRLQPTCLSNRNPIKTSVARKSNLQ